MTDLSHEKVRAVLRELRDAERRSIDAAIAAQRAGDNDRKRYQLGKAGAYGDAWRIVNDTWRNRAANTSHEEN